MRVTTADWLAGKRNPLEITSSKMNKASGLMHAEHTLLVVPVSEEARMDMMTGWGIIYDASKNQHFFDLTSSSGYRSSQHCNNLRDHGEPLVLKNQSYFDLKLMKFAIKHYKRVGDEFTVTGGHVSDKSRDGTPIRVDLPCGDWAVFIAPRHAVKEKVFNPMTGAWE